MVNLALSVIFSSLIFVIFKLFRKYDIETLYAIITNYFVACIVGVLFYQKNVSYAEIPKKPWFLGSLLLGFLFILVFNLMAATSQKSGVSVASVATKMSLVIPVLFSVGFYNEKLSFLKIVGIVLALAAVYFVSVKEKGFKINKRVLILPLSVFIGSGIIDTSIKYLETSWVPQEEFPLFSAAVFASAASIGFIYLIIKSFKTRISINLKNVLAGVCLGIPNYFSVYFLLNALQHESLSTATVFTLNHVAIVMLSTLLGIILFKEHMSKKNWAGIALAVASIFLVALF
ncbi:Glucose uptake protein GlcU [Arenibacter nanhaiticus]|uniref:Glucose uptake protein GlcU n=1 Tax=Arenibacter nanhaiticus TaxID=558155 RepID=A0A1M6K524_9FLAO|nr:EamA family transporter [Arenibacter nanhaiticus]SHJ54066.1 Glucose uptake protein GlcU [Arenibacter nanhaiticus]